MDAPSKLLYNSLASGLSTFTVISLIAMPCGKIENIQQQRVLIL
jgi:hypothetical protein